MNSRTDPTAWQASELGITRPEALAPTTVIGTSLPRPEALRFVAGKGRYLDDIQLEGMLHVAFLRSPFARARFTIGDLDVAKQSPGVIAIVTGAELAAVCKPWRTVMALAPSHVSAPQTAMAIDETYWQGEAVIAAVARTRAEAEDALEKAEVDWDEIEPVIDPTAALAEDAAPCHPALTTNLALDKQTTVGAVDDAFAAAACIATHRFEFGRQTGVTLDPRGIVASFDARVGELTVHQSHQVPFQQQEIFAAQLSLPLEAVRVICPDVGGAFGIKLHAYADEIAVVAMARLLGKPLKYQCDRLESFVTDVHAREATADARLAVDAEGRILALDVDLLFSFGAFSAYPRSSLGEALQALDLCGAAYQMPAFRGRVRGAFLNKVPTGAYRAVGQPLACAIIEQLLDDAAAAVGIDPVEIRRLNHLPPLADDVPTRRTIGGVAMGPLSLDECLDKLVSTMRYEQLREEQASLRELGVYRGIGLCNFVELTSVGAGLYGPQGVRAAGKESVRLTLQTNGKVLCRASATDQGQGVRTGIAQIVASTLGVGIDRVVVASGDTSIDPMGGGAWASRGIALGGEAALRAATALRTNIIDIAAAYLRVPAEALRIDGAVVTDATGSASVTLEKIALMSAYDALAVPMIELPPLSVERSFAPADKPYFAANGVQAAHVEVDIETGLIKVLEVWVVEDCGVVVNPLLVDEQVRGGVVQGIGAALFEHCVYSDTGQMTNASLADYLVPMASEMPDVHVSHVSTPERGTALGAKGVGEAGTVGAIGALWSAVNDALRPTGRAVFRQPFTPAHVMDVLDGYGDSEAGA